MSGPGPRPIEDHGVIGDLGTVALVDMDGRIDFLSFPRFDSPTIFCSLLDEERGGYFQIAPLRSEQDGDPGRKQLYLPDSNVLLTRFLSPGGVGEITDFMPIESGTPLPNLVRCVRTVRGQVRYRMVCAPRFDYGRAAHTVERASPCEVLFVSQGEDGTALRLRGARPLEIRGGDAVCELTLGAGESASFVLEAARPGAPSPASAPDFVEQALSQTSRFWRRWIGRSTYRGRWREVVNRSALVLKLLTSAEHGSIIAAPTFGLPEDLGGVRNWDYRYTWIRDASFTLYALSRLGFNDEAGAFMHWIEDRCAELREGGALQIMYGVDGHTLLEEQVLPHLRGYRGSRPVRIGNGASQQLQLDIYGELMDSVYLYNKYGAPISHGLWRRLVKLMDWVCDNWRRPDEGIWETRGGRQEFLHSRLMCWVALDRAVRLAGKRSFPAPLARWYRERDAIYEDIFTGFWDPRRRAFVQHKGARAVDASSLLMPLLKFVSPTDPMWLSSLRAVDEELSSDALVFRYLAGPAGPAADDGLGGSDGTFSVCSFWFVECLARAGQVERARLLFEKMLGYANHLGLYSEELGPRGEHLGNFPQAFTHLGLISAAYALDHVLSQAGWRD